MRIKAILNYYFTVNRFAAAIFFSFFMAGTLLGSFISSVGSNRSVALAVYSGETQQSWNITIISFLIFMIISTVINSQSGTRFLITRSASRKEIFTAHAFFLIPLSATMALLQIISLHIDDALRAWLSGTKPRGLNFDFQSLMAPNMNNIFVFFLVSFSFLFCFASIAFLIGSCMARWKFQTIGTLIIMTMIFVTCLVIPDVIEYIIDVLKFMFIDENNGLWIALKQFILGCLILALSFPVMRRITAAKASKQ